MGSAAPTVPSMVPRAALPKVPSLLFEMELNEDGAKATHPNDEMDLQLVEAELRRFLRPSAPAVVALAQRVQASAVGAAAPAVLDSIQAALQGQQQYRVFVRRALGGGEGSLCLHNLRHTFLSVQCPGMDKAIVVDPSFAEQFIIAKPTPRYESILGCLPSVLVLPEDRLPPLVTFLCAELASAFKASQTVVPPWRQASAMLSKWQPRRSLDVPSTLLQQQQQMYTQGIKDTERQVFSGMPGVWPAPSKVAASAPMYIKPVVSEPPHRVYGGFGASFGGYINNLAS